MLSDLAHFTVVNFALKFLRGVKLNGHNYNFSNFCISTDDVIMTLINWIALGMNV